MHPAGSDGSMTILKEMETQSQSGSNLDLGIFQRILLLTELIFGNSVEIPTKCCELLAPLVKSTRMPSRIISRRRDLHCMVLSCL